MFPPEHSDRETATNLGDTFKDTPQSNVNILVFKFTQLEVYLLIEYIFYLGVHLMQNGFPAIQRPTFVGTTVMLGLCSCTGGTEYINQS